MPVFSHILSRCENCSLSLRKNINQQFSKGVQRHPYVSRVPLGVLRVPLGMPRVPLGVPKKFGCNVIVDKGTFINNLFKTNSTSTYTVLS